MANVEMDLRVDGHLLKLSKFVKDIPTIRKRYLKFIGAKGEKILKNDYYSGQVMNLRAYPLDKAGKKTIQSVTNKTGTYVKFFSYPGNLFEENFTRYGHPVIGQHAIRKGLKGDLLANMGSYDARFDSIISKELAKI